MFNSTGKIFKSLAQAHNLPSSAWRTCKSLAQVTFATLTGEHTSHSRKSLAQLCLENMQVNRANHLYDSTWITYKSLAVTCTTLPGEHASHSCNPLAQLCLENMQVTRTSHLPNPTSRPWKSIAQVTCATLPGEHVSHSRKSLNNSTWRTCKSLAPGEHIRHFLKLHVHL